MRRGETRNRVPAGRLVSANQALVDQNLHVHLAILGSTGLGLVRRRIPVFAHSAGRDDMPYRDAALLHQIGDYRLGAALTQRGVYGSIAGGVGITDYLDDVSL